MFNHDHRALRLLSQFQVLEFSLKVYIDFAHQIIKLKLEGEMPYKHSAEQVDSFPLERLLKVFSLLNDNTELQSKLNKLPAKRNDLAHKALLYDHPVLGQLYDANLRDRHYDMNRVEGELEECMELLSKDMATIAGKYRRLKA